MRSSRNWMNIKIIDKDNARAVVSNATYNPPSKPSIAFWIFVANCCGSRSPSACVMPTTVPRNPASGSPRSRCGPARSCPAALPNPCRTSISVRRPSRRRIPCGGSLAGCPARDAPSRTDVRTTDSCSTCCISLPTSSIFCPAGGISSSRTTFSAQYCAQHFKRLQSERRQTHEEQSRLDDQDGMRGEVAMHRGLVEWPAIDQHVEDAARRGAQQQGPTEMGEDREKRMPLVVFRHRGILCFGGSRSHAEHSTSNESYTTRNVLKIGASIQLVESLSSKPAESATPLQPANFAKVARVAQPINWFVAVASISR